MGFAHAKERHMTIMGRDVRRIRLVAVCTLITVSLLAGSLMHSLFAGLFLRVTDGAYFNMINLRQGTLPFNVSTKPRAEDAYTNSVTRALTAQRRNGFLIGNSSHLEFHEYPDDVSLRIIVMAFNRPDSLTRCLDLLQAADYTWDRVAVEVWLDRNESQVVDADTLRVARNFSFKHGAYRVHVQPQHAGIQGQWTNTWRPLPDTKEIAVILEDDMDVSPHYWKWLKAAQTFYAHYPNISGFSLSHPGISHQTAHFLTIPKQYHVYLYPVICTWGFSPQPRSWNMFQEWFYTVAEVEEGFMPLVPDILPSKWFLGEKRLGRERLLWEMWHIYYTYVNREYTLLLNSQHVGLMAVNRHEEGVHDGINSPVGATEPLCARWNDWFTDFPDTVQIFGYDGQAVKAVPATVNTTV